MLLARSTTAVVVECNKMFAGLRAKEIASITWAMLATSDGEIGHAIALQDAASKGLSGRTIPLNRELREALIELRADLRECRSSPYVIAIALEED
jgi:integrase